MEFDPVKRRIFECITGSKLYGTDTPESDIDLRGICIPPKEVLLNPFMNFNQKDSGFEEGDRCIYALGQFVKLCADANPNILELLFIPDNKIVFNSKIWKRLLDFKYLFISKKIKHTFSGYAMSQLHKMKKHREWFLNPPKEKPTRKGFGLTDSPKISGAGLQALASISLNLFKEEFGDEIRRELSYRDEKKKWDNYVSWRDNRNPIRRKMEEKFGYDGKAASHLFRLIKEGKELLLTGNIIFPLRDAEEILDVKNGKYSYEEIIGIAEKMDNDFDLWYEQSPLPDKPNQKEIKELYFDIIDFYEEEEV